MIFALSEWFGYLGVLPLLKVLLEALLGNPVWRAYLVDLDVFLPDAADDGFSAAVLILVFGDTDIICVNN